MPKNAGIVHLKRNLIKIKCSDYESVTTFFSKSKRAPLRDLINDHSPSLSVSRSHFSIPLLAWRPVWVDPIHYLLQLSLTYLLSKSIHCFFSASCQSRAVGHTQGLLEVSCLPLNLSTYKFSDLSLSHTRALSHPQIKVYKKSRLPGNLLALQ